jgi:peptidoglycan/xylan/chitin deacetylase (PgdA/CDA1 family)
MTSAGILLSASCVLAAALLLEPQEPLAAPKRIESADLDVSILVYHRFAPSVRDAMTVRTSTFRWQLDYLREHRYPIIPLRALVSYLLGQSPSPPPRSIVITVDDGHRSIFTEMLPIVRELDVPVTLFIYPSAISNAPYAMTWAQLESLHSTGLFDIQSHTFWHPNFKAERRRLSPQAFRALAMMQLSRSRTVLRQQLGVTADLIAWPFGISDDELIGMAQDAGYIAGFTLDRRTVTSSDRVMALPRFLVTDGAVGQNFTAMLPRGNR